ncbi:hypothetical protein phiAS5_ORF0142 [Aeromonas phage phiAS5]|uniref:Uncharacterized protein n=1 Tax=Aeromonas phage phiAS5 TaxID=879630 RepID=E1A2N9_9CAUD|nr:hypothetical protein phiAS5_ORF0142 [Aeromonas phage phiAS5]ADM79985.1 hypothetical protein phiAS5_ORF0142 [Aeromonas phage phiAS5]BES53242.1 hypothetical protein [Aeromonas phage phiWae14]
MKIDLHKEYNIDLANGTFKRAKLIDVIENWETYHLKRFGTFLHIGTYGKYRHEIKEGIEKNGFYVHNGYRLTYIANKKTKDSWGWFDLFVGFATCAGIITDDGGRVIDPNMAMQVYHKQAKRKAPSCMSWNARDRGSRKSVYGYRKPRGAIRIAQRFMESQRRQDLEVNEYEWDLYREEWYEGNYEAGPGNWYDIPEPPIRRSSIIDSYEITEAWWDRADRAVQKSWKWQSKRRRQWKPKSEITETY